MSQSFDYDLVCIGSGPAGQRAAVQAAKLGKRVAVIEKRRCVGGVCIETGTIPSKTFREAVRSFTARGPRATGAVGRATHRPSMRAAGRPRRPRGQREVESSQDQLAPQRRRR